ncbi:sulfur oxidation c-type cytochrome SoxA [Parasulfuritortus cantonensis]|uniref:SoxAX cytochrome complex subunit A n=1 Tax=Parasulfuritortus cantonensis TaxID=2528202 RepID=A0A4V2NW31_9PROT|nr:sulfur oxidation c-type cytochrome SoxA [Parasulfuritortus cantonensis]TCJ15762.1 sulfur oxidation c-type cytochrome SoxA [Parasulfuritortus cantonensis]
MKKLIMILAGAGIVLGSVSAVAGPEDDRTKLINYFKNKYSDIKIDDYIYGALAFSPDSKSQYDSIMEFPPFVEVLDKGKKMWDTPFKSGKTYADCLPNGGKMIAGNYPMFDEAKGKVVTFEDAINDCRVANGEEPYKYDDMKTMGVLTSYARTLSDGMKMNIKVDSPAALKAFEDGKKTYYARAGQLNFSCASCHIDAAGNNLRSEILSPVLGQATHFPVFRGKDGGDVPTTLQKRYSGCFKQVRQVPDKEGSTRFNNLEYFHSYLSNGMELKSSVFRK